MPQPKIIGFRKDIPTFCRLANEDYPQWIFSIKMTLRTYGLNDNEAAIAICHYLKRTPLYNYENYINECEHKNKGLSFKEFIDILDICYGLTKTSCSFEIVYLIILIYSLINKVIIKSMIKIDIFIVKF